MTKSKLRFAYLVIFSFLFLIIIATPIVYIILRDHLNLLPQSNIGIENCINQYYKALPVNKDTEAGRSSESLVIKLKNRYFLPNQNYEMAIQCFSLLEDNTSYYLILQFSGILSSKDKKIMSAAGLTEVSYLPDRSYFFELSQPLSTTQATKLFSQLSVKIRWIGTLKATDKSNPKIWESGGTIPSTDGLGSIYAISMFSGTTVKQASTIINKYGSITTDPTQSQTGTTATAALTLESMRDLAQENRVRWIEDYAQPTIYNQ